MVNNAEKEAVLAIDPGRNKSGLAVLDFNSKVLYKDIIISEKIRSYLLELFNIYNIKKILIGNGTYSEELIADIKKVAELPIELVDEAYTTVEAEERYRREKDVFWQKILFFISWKSNKALDDYVAVILGERYLKKGQVDKTSK